MIDGMVQLDSLVATCLNLARMEDGPTKRGLQHTAFEMLQEYEHEGHITADMRLMLEKIVVETPPPHPGAPGHTTPTDNL